MLLLSGKNQNRGIVLLTVLMAIIILSMFLVNIIGLSLSQSNVSLAQVHEIQAQELAKGAFWKAITGWNGGYAGDFPSSSEPLNDGQGVKNFTVQGIIVHPPGWPISVTVTYP